MKPEQSEDQPDNENVPSRPPAFGAAAFIFQGDYNRYVNPAGEQMTGYTAEELYRMKFWEVIHPEHRELVRSRGRARQLGETVPWHYEVRLLRKDGTSIWVEFSGGMIEYQGQPAVLGTAIDITERRAAAERARESDLWLRALLENSTDVVLVADAELRLHYIGPSMERILGWKVEEMLGSNNFDRIHPGDLPVVRAAYDDLIRAPGRRAIATYRIRHRDGSWRWFESIGTNLLDDRAVRGIIINSRDVTDRVAAEAAYRSLVDHSLQGLVIIQDGKIVFANPTITEVTGYTVDELHALGLHASLLLHPDDAQAIVATWREHLATGNAAKPRRSEFRIIRKDGGVRWIEMYLAIAEYHGRPAMQVTYLDISDRKRAQEQARRHQQELAHVLRRRTMGEMAAVFAHEVNQPLTAILNYATGCTRRLRSGMTATEPLLSALDEIAAQALRAGEIIRRLRSFVRKSELQRELHDLNAVASEAIQFIAPEATDRAVQMQVDLAPALPRLELDAVQIEQVILNLLRNALEAIYEDGGTRPLVRIATRPVEDGVELTVSDTGPGLPPELAGEIFEPFVTTKAEGMGMGLSICRSIVDAHGGRIWWTPNTPRGATFHILLPLPGGTR